MCSSGDQTASALEKTQAASANALNADALTSFADQQAVLQNVQAKMNFITANPMGYTPPQLAQARTSINENTAMAAKQAIGAAGAFAAAHGGSDVGNGAIGQVAGTIASGAAQSKAGQLAELSNQNEAMKQSNFWKGIQGLNSVGSEFGGAGGTQIGGANNAANSSVNAGQLKLSSEQAGWQNAMGIVAGTGGLISAGAGA